MTSSLYFSFMNWYLYGRCSYSSSSGVLGQVSIVSHSYKTYFSFLGFIVNFVVGYVTIWSQGSHHILISWFNL